MDFISSHVRLSKLLEASLLITWILHVCDAAVSARTGTICTHNEVYMEGNATHCVRQYLRCEDTVWNRAICVGGYFNSTMKECVPADDHCQQYLDINDRSLPLARSRRQATTQSSCDQSYSCPEDLIQEFIYPDWDNRDCDTYYKCLKGVLKLHSCESGIYKYYNPRTFSCEEYPSVTNTCLRRYETRLGPIL